MWRQRVGEHMSWEIVVWLTEKTECEATVEGKSEILMMILNFILQVPYSHLKV